MYLVERWIHKLGESKRYEAWFPVQTAA